MSANMKIQLMAMMAAFTACMAQAEEEVMVDSSESSDPLWGWNISAGGNMGFGLKTKLKMSPANAARNLPRLTPSFTRNKAAAEALAKPVANGQRVIYGYDANGKAYYVDPDSTWGEQDPSQTWNWRLPDSARQGNAFIMTQDNLQWGEVISESSTSRNVGDSDNDVSYGASVELSHELWMSEDATWGVDFAIGLTWMRANNCFKQHGVAVTRSATTEEGDGTATTTIPGRFFDLGYNEPESDGTWGNDSRDGSNHGRQAFILDLDDISTSLPSHLVEYSDSMSLSAHGDYEEWEISAVLRPWYDVNEWLCVHGALGFGVTRSEFDYSMEAICNGARIYRSSQSFDEWRCYGIAGGGFLLRCWDFDFSCDALFRWCQDDMSIRSRDVNGSIDKPWAVLRFGLSYAF